MTLPIAWADAREAVFEAGSAVASSPVPVPLVESDGLTLADIARVNQKNDQQGIHVPSPLLLLCVRLDVPHSPYRLKSDPS